MNDLNNVSLVARLTKDAELKNVNGYSKLDFSVAYTTTRKSGNEYQDESNFLNLSLWGKIAESLSGKLLKGVQVAIEGHLKQNVWEKDNKKHYETIVVVDSLQMLGGSKKTEGSGFKPVENKQPENEGFSEDIPF